MCEFWQEWVEQKGKEPQEVARRCGYYEKDGKYTETQKKTNPDAD